VIINGAVTNYLDLRLTRNGLEIGMQNRLLVFTGLVVPVSISLRQCCRYVWLK
jgi:hypothetical protein